MDATSDLKASESAVEPTEALTAVAVRDVPRTNRLRRRWSALLSLVRSRPLDAARAGLGVGLLLLIVVHGLWGDQFDVDTTTLGLVGLVLIVLVLPKIAELEAFGVKAKLNVDDVLARATVEDQAAPRPTEETRPLVAPIRRAAATSDPISIALAARTIIQTTLRRLHRLVDVGRPTATDEQVRTELLQRGYISADQNRLIREITELANSVAHRGSIEPDDARNLDESARRCASAIARNAPQAFEAEVCSLLLESGLELVPARGSGGDPDFDFTVKRPTGEIFYVEAKFVSSKSLKPEPPRDIMMQMPATQKRLVYVVVTRPPDDKKEPPAAPSANLRILTLLQFVRLIESGRLGDPNF